MSSSSTIKGTFMTVSKYNDFNSYSFIDKNHVFKAIEDCVSRKICGLKIAISSEVNYSGSGKNMIFYEVCR